MKELKQDRKSRYTRMVLRDSLVELMKTKPITKITIKELCENADINRSTFYSHNSNQYDLLNSIEEETLSWAKKSISYLMDKHDIQETKNILLEMFKSIKENSQHLQVLMSEKGDIDFQKRLFALIYEECGINLAAGEHKDKDMNESYFVFVVNGSVGLIQHWLKNGMTKSAEEMADIIYQLTFAREPNEMK